MAGGKQAITFETHVTRKEYQLSREYSVDVVRTMFRRLGGSYRYEPDFGISFPALAVPLAIPPWRRDDMRSPPIAPARAPPKQVPTAKKSGPPLPPAKVELLELESLLAEI